VCVCVCVRVCVHMCVCVVVFFYESDMEHPAEVSEVYCITELNLLLHVNHTSNINNNIQTVYVSNVYTNLSYPLTSAAIRSRGSASVWSSPQDGSVRRSWRRKESVSIMMEVKNNKTCCSTGKQKIARASVFEM